jgi:hypothetical protein
MDDRPWPQPAQGGAQSAATALQPEQAAGVRDWPNIHARDARTAVSATAMIAAPRALRSVLKSPTALAGSAIAFAHPATQFRDVPVDDKHRLKLTA